MLPRFSVAWHAMSISSTFLMLFSWQRSLDANATMWSFLGPCESNNWILLKHGQLRVSGMSECRQRTRGRVSHEPESQHTEGVNICWTVRVTALECDIATNTHSFALHFFHRQVRGAKNQFILTWPLAVFMPVQFTAVICSAVASRWVNVKPLRHPSPTQFC